MCSACEDRQEPGQLDVSASASTAARVAPRTATSAVAQARSRPTELTWQYESTSVGSMYVVVSVPAHDEGQTFPMLVAFHGQGEALKGPQRGARGWLDDYHLRTALERLRHPPLRVKDFGGFINAKRLQELNASLKRHPYRGMVVVMPFTPVSLGGEEGYGTAKKLAEFLADDVIPRAMRETPARQDAVAVDGVSLGGRAALLVALERPHLFASAGTVQLAIDASEVVPLGDRIRSAQARHPALKFRFLTSSGDYFLGVHRRLAKQLDAEETEYRLLVAQGPHDYAFNRGPGVYEMLLYHERQLRRLPTP